MRVISLIIFLACISTLLIAGENNQLLLGIEEVEKMALSQNQQILSLQELYKKAREGRYEAISKWLPKLMAMSDLFTNKQKQLFPLGYKNTFLTQLTLTQQIFSTEKYHDVKLASLWVEQLSLLLKALENDILFAARSLYYKIVLDYEMIATAEEHINILRELSNRLEYEYQIGTTILLNVNQSKVAIANATTTYYQRIKDLKSDKDRLSELLGIDPGDKELTIVDMIIPVDDFDEIREKLDHVEEIFTGEEGDAPIYKERFPENQIYLMRNLYSIQEIRQWEQIAERFNPVLQGQLNEVAIASEEVKKEVGTYFPTVELVANLGGEPNPYNFYPKQTIGKQEFQFGIGIQAKWLLFDGFGRESRVRQSRYQRNAKQYDYQRTKQTTMKDVRNQIFTIEESIANYVTSDGNVILADQTLLQAKDQFEIGYITIYDYQLAVNGLIEARNTLSRSAYDLVNGYYALRHAAGVDVRD